MSDDDGAVNGTECTVLPFGSVSVARRSRRQLRQSPDRDKRGAPIDAAFMGLTSSSGVSVHAKYKLRRGLVQFRST
jgi:hypothetical protein